MRSRYREFTASFTLAAAGFCFDDDVVAACIIRQIALIDTQEQHSVSLRHKISSRPDEDEVVVVVTDHGDESAGRLIAHQLVRVRNVVHPARSRKTSASD